MRRALLAAAALLLGCGDRLAVSAGPLIGSAQPPAPASLGLGAFRVEWGGASWRDASLRIHHEEREDAVFRSLPGRSFVSAARGRARYRERRAMFRVSDRVTERCARQRVDSVASQGDAVGIEGVLDCLGRQVGYRMTLRPVGRRQLALQVETDDESLDRLVLTLASDPEERVFGFGEQFTHFDLKGRLVPVFVMEQGIGRGLRPLTWLVDLAAGAGGSWHTSYAPVPQLQTTRRRGLVLENAEFSRFDLREPDRIAVEVFAPRVAARLLSASDPLELVSEYTSYAGRMRRLPPWAHAGAIVGLQGGTARVREAVAALEAEGAPLAAVWLQDWVGRRTTSFGEQLWWAWELDRQRYPGWEALVEELHAKGVRVLLYVNPFLVDTSGRAGGAGRDFLAEARAAGLLVRGRDGEPATVTITDFDAALLDLTNPEARRWIKRVILRNLIGIGASGWMADFGEGLPADAVLASGESGASFHNRYPEEWARVNREAIEEAGRGDDVVFFTRSGYTRSPGWSTLFWEGDQLVSWDEHDGIKSSVTGLLSGGLSGFSLNHSDVGGYTTIEAPLVGVTRSRELLWRWIELGAFQVVFRTHEGNLPEANHQPDSDPETLRHFARFAKVHAAWAFYRERLLREAESRGWPVWRHPYLHHPDEPAYRALRYEQLLVGEALWFAPVLDPGHDAVLLRLPAGRFVHAFTGEAWESEGPHAPLSVPAPPGLPAVLYAEGSEVGERFRANLLAAGVAEPTAPSAAVSAPTARAPEG